MGNNTQLGELENANNYSVENEICQHLRARIEARIRAEITEQVTVEVTERFEADFKIRFEAEIVERLAEYDIDVSDE